MVPKHDHDLIPARSDPWTSRDWWPQNKNKIKASSHFISFLYFTLVQFLLHIVAKTDWFTSCLKSSDNYLLSQIMLDIFPFCFLATSHGSVWFLENHIILGIEFGCLGTKHTGSPLASLPPNPYLSKIIFSKPNSFQKIHLVLCSKVILHVQKTTHSVKSWSEDDCKQGQLSYPWYYLTGPLISYFFIVIFLFGPHLVQGLLLALHWGITLGGLRVPGNKRGLIIGKASTWLSLWPYKLHSVSLIG